jgi:hypothetical protein
LDFEDILLRRPDDKRIRIRKGSILRKTSKVSFFEVALEC